MIIKFNDNVGTITIDFQEQLVTIEGGTSDNFANIEVGERAYNSIELLAFAMKHKFEFGILSGVPISLSVYDFEKNLEKFNSKDLVLRVPFDKLKDLQGTRLKDIKSEIMDSFLKDSIFAETDKNIFRIASNIYAVVDWQDFSSRLSEELDSLEDSQEIGENFNWLNLALK